MTITSTITTNSSMEMLHVDYLSNRIVMLSRVELGLLFISLRICWICEETSLSAEQ